MQSVRELVRAGKAQLTANSISEIDAEIFIAHLLGVDRKELHSFPSEMPDEQFADLKRDFNHFITERINGTPTQYLVGEAPFRYLVFDVGPGVLIPRPETELLVDAALREIKEIYEKQNRTVSVVDLGAGSGAIAISIAFEAQKHNFPVTVVAVEKEAAALEWLKKNIQKYEVDIRVVHEDVATALDGVSADIVIANPPYIPETIDLPREVRREPMTALIGGADGSDVPKRFIDAALRMVKPGGLFILEHFESHGRLLAEYLATGFTDISLHSDLTQRPRWTSARRKSSSELSGQVR